MKEKRTELVKARVSPREKRRLERIAWEENTSVSKLMVRRALEPKNQKLKKLEQEKAQREERMKKEKMVVAQMCSSVNQIDAGVNTEQALSEIKKGVEMLWQLLN